MLRCGRDIVLLALSSFIIIFRSLGLATSDLSVIVFYVVQLLGTL
jgi:hypothetical protein